MLHSCWCIILIECGLNSNLYLNSNFVWIRNRKERENRDRKGAQTLELAQTQNNPAHGKTQPNPPSLRAFPFLFPGPNPQPRLRRPSSPLRLTQQHRSLQPGRKPAAARASSAQARGPSVTPQPTDSTREVENLSDETEELCSSSFFLDLCNTYLELSAVMPEQCCLNRIEP